MAKPATNPNGREVTSGKKLKSLLASCRSTQNDITELAGTLGEQIKSAVENHHLHKKAFNVCKMADRMEPEKLAEFLEQLEHYLEATGLNERAASAPRMDMGAAGEQTENEADEAEQDKAAKRNKGARGNVRAFPAPVGEAAE